MLFPLVSTVLLSATAQATPIVRVAAHSRELLDTAVAAPIAKRLSLDLRSGGAVRITGGTDRVVRIRVTQDGKSCGDCGVTIDQASDGLQVRSQRGVNTGKLQFEIEVPQHFDLQLASAGGEVTIEGVDGEIKGETEAGALELRRLSGTVDLQTKRGDITLRESYASGRVHTIDGRVLLEDVGGTVAGSSASGKVVERRVERPVAQ
jgi:hypothetical protein